MAIATETGTAARLPLTRERVLQAAVALADREGIASVSMRKVAAELGVEAMSLYNHVANKEDLLDGMVDLVVGEIDAPAEGVDWKAAMRGRILSAREALLRHPWASAVMASRVNMTGTVMRYMESTMALLRQGGFSVDLTHHAIHVLGSRIFGFAQELYDDSEALAASPDIAMLEQMAADFPTLTELASQISHEGPTVGIGCDSQLEFEFGLDIMLDGLERLRLAQA